MIVLWISFLQILPVTISYQLSCPGRIDSLYEQGVQKLSLDICYRLCLLEMLQFSGFPGWMSFKKLSYQPVIWIQWHLQRWFWKSTNRILAVVSAWMTTLTQIVTQWGFPQMRLCCLCTFQTIHAQLCVTAVTSSGKNLWKSEELFLAVVQAWRVAKCVFH